MEWLQPIILIGLKIKTDNKTNTSEDVAIRLGVTDCVLISKRKSGKAPCPHFLRLGVRVGVFRVPIPPAVFRLLAMDRANFHDLPSMMIELRAT